VTVELLPDLRERFEPGAFRAQTRDPGRARMCLEHGQVIGPILSLEEREDGLYFEAGISRSDAIPEARRARALIEEGLADELSVGFNTVRNGTTVTREDDGTHLAVHHRAKLLEISLVPWGVYSREAVLQRATIVDHAAELLEERREETLRYLEELKARVLP
jgi:HK97 family phage prohead protease